MTHTNVRELPVDDPILIRAFRHYEAGEYEKALEDFAAVERTHGVFAELGPYVERCDNATSIEHSTEDEQYLLFRRLAPLLKWLYVAGVALGLVGLVSFGYTPFDAASIRAWFELLMAVAVLRGAIGFDQALKDRNEKRRCKYCGHYTRYVQPNEGVAYLSTNNCRVCGRGYPMPDVFWDGDEGKRYIYGRGSVTDPQFYSEFEADNPNCERSQAADYWLRGEGAARIEEEHADD